MLGEEVLLRGWLGCGGGFGGVAAELFGGGVGVGGGGGGG